MVRDSTGGLVGAWGMTGTGAAGGVHPPRRPRTQARISSRVTAPAATTTAVSGR